jgi:hypothetical protein
MTTGRAACGGAVRHAVGTALVLLWLANAFGCPDPASASTIFQLRTDIPSRGAGSGSGQDPDPAPGTAGGDTVRTQATSQNQADANNREGTAHDRGDTATTWMSEEAAADSLALFWDELDGRWLGARDPQLPEFELDETTLDSLVAVSKIQLRRMARGSHVSFGVNPVGRMAFNRVQGPVIGASVSWTQAAAVRSRLEIGAGYGFSNRTGVWDVTLDVPLVTRRRTLPRGLGPGQPYRWLALEMSAYRRARMFGGDGRKIRYFTSLIYGSDPNSYYDVIGGRVRLVLQPARWLRIRGGFEGEEHTPLTVTTDWNLFGWNLSPPGNLLAAPLRTTAVTAGLSFEADWLDGAVDLRWHDVDDSPWQSEPGHLSASGRYLRTRARLGIDLLDRHGNRYLLQGHYRGVDRSAPAQWQTFLGDYKTLRGYPAMELAGDQGAWASLDVRWGFDLWRALRIPGLKDLGLQTVTFLDWGRTWVHDEPATDESLGQQGWRMDAGVGFGKLLGIPGRSGNLRLYIAHPVFDGQHDRGWRVLLALEK